MNEDGWLRPMTALFIIYPTTAPVGRIEVDVAAGDVVLKRDVLFDRALVDWAADCNAE